MHKIKKFQKYLEIRFIEIQEFHNFYESFNSDSPPINNVHLFLIPTILYRSVLNSRISSSFITPFLSIEFLRYPITLVRLHKINIKYDIIHPIYQFNYLTLIHKVINIVKTTVNK